MNTSNKPSQETLDKWQKDPTNWKLFVFYFNKEDKRIFPPKRSKLGWTINFANPRSILAMVGIVIAAMSIVKLIRIIFPNLWT